MLKTYGLIMNYSDIKHLIPAKAGSVRADHNKCLPTKNTLQITVGIDGRGFAYCFRCSQSLRFNLGVQLEQSAVIKTAVGELRPEHNADLWPIEAHMWFMKAGVSVDTMLAAGWRYVPHWSRQQLFTMAPRLCMQLYDAYGKPAGVSARRIHDYDTKAKSLKLGSQTAFIVSDFKDNKLVLVEDELSWTKLYGLGISSACLQGTSLPDDVKKYIQKNKPRTFLFLDNDSKTVSDKTNRMFKELSLYTTARVVYARKGCKNHTNEELEELLK